MASTLIAMTTATLCTDLLLNGKVIDSDHLSDSAPIPA